MKNYRIRKIGDVFYAQERFLGIFWYSIYEERDPFTGSYTPRKYFSKESAFNALKNCIKSRQKEQPENWYYSSSEFE